MLDTTLKTGTDSITETSTFQYCRIPSTQKIKFKRFFFPLLTALFAAMFLEVVCESCLFIQGHVSVYCLESTIKDNKFLVGTSSPSDIVLS